MTDISFRLEVEQNHVYLLNLQLQNYVSCHVVSFGSSLPMSQFTLHGRGND